MYIFKIFFDIRPDRVRLDTHTANVGFSIVLNEFVVFVGISSLLQIMWAKQINIIQLSRHLSLFLLDHLQWPHHNSTSEYKSLMLKTWSTSKKSYAKFASDLGFSVFLNIFQ